MLCYYILPSLTILDVLSLLDVIAIPLGFIIMFWFIIRNQQECQKIFKATEPIEKSTINQKLIGFGVGSIDSIDPNPDNYVAAAIVHTRTQQIGCLLRLEPNSKAEVTQLILFSVSMALERKRGARWNTCCWRGACVRSVVEEGSDPRVGEILGH